MPDRSCLINLPPVQVAFSVRRIYSTPSVLPLDAPPELFSEARALSTVKDLTETIGYRLVSLAWSFYRLSVRACHVQ